LQESFRFSDNPNHAETSETRKQVSDVSAFSEFPIGEEVQYSASRAHPARESSWNFKIFVRLPGESYDDGAAPVLSKLFMRRKRKWVFL
jgi:hypothetical protein